MRTGVRAYVSYFALREVTINFTVFLPWWPWRAAIVYAFRVSRIHRLYIYRLNTHSLSLRMAETIRSRSCVTRRFQNYYKFLERRTMIAEKRDGGGRRNHEMPVLVNRADRYGKLSSRKLVRCTRSIDGESLKRDISSSGSNDRLFFLIDLFEFIIQRGDGRVSPSIISFSPFFPNNYRNILNESCRILNWRYFLCNERIDLEEWEKLIIRI